MSTTIFDIISAGAPGATAIGAPGMSPLSYAGLKGQAERTVKALNERGIGRNDRVAIVLENGPEMATAFLCIAAGATTAPLNPAYREDEFDFYLTDLKAKALVVSYGSTSPAVAVAQKHSIPVIEIEGSLYGAAGDFRVRGKTSDTPAANGGMAQAGDCALILHTSGTTSRPKIVPLSQANVCASAKHISETLALTPKDICLNIMPLFHIHGLIAAVLSSLRAGASVICSPGFNALQFFSWVNEVAPTWYTAVPTMHQAILSRAARNKEVIEANKLRFIRSSSASLPPQVMTELEEVFGAPVIEAYGMTEASHQMASNPLPPKAHKAGSVGLPGGPQVEIMDEAGNILSNGQTGEIVIKGPNVFAGYESNEKANAEAFTNGWFRTGDQGVKDAEGYISLTGRLKEIINRGGEKISPREVDEIILDHPAVEQVVTFAMKHDKLGEDVAAAVVLREGQEVSEADLRKFVGERVADFKVPRKVLFLKEIPKGATGKLQRIGLAEKLGL